METFVIPERDPGSLAVALGGQRSRIKSGTTLPVA
jgi:hypothetical protein